MLPCSETFTHYIFNSLQINIVLVCLVIVMNQFDVVVAIFTFNSQNSNKYILYLLLKVGSSFKEPLHAHELILLEEIKTGRGDRATDEIFNTRGVKVVSTLEGILRSWGYPLHKKIAKYLNVLNLILSTNSLSQLRRSSIKKLLLTSV